ncbi:hypothetical protein ABEB36_003101 [Hypothenemus hampei]|uniref:Retrotransposon gag domain-containing protein n=1 Tax=Hypothenemus hampei TaxID=57062 RepID=A0ABD1F810_HYPHA
MFDIVKPTEKDLLTRLIFGTKLEGKAQEVTLFKNFADWTELRDYLLDQFSDTQPPSYFSKQITQVKQNFRETVKDYGERFKSLYNKYVESCNLTYERNKAGILIENLGSSLVEYFREGLLDERVQMRVIAENTDNLHRAITVAMELENSSRTRQFQRGNYTNYGNQYNFNTRSSQICSFCDKTGHSTEECRKLKDYKKNQQTQSSQYFNQNSNKPKRFQYNQNITENCYSQGNFYSSNPAGNRYFNRPNFNRNNNFAHSSNQGNYDRKNVVPSRNNRAETSDSHNYNPNQGSPNFSSRQFRDEQNYNFHPQHDVRTIEVQSHSPISSNMSNQSGNEQRAAVPDSNLTAL